MKTREDYIEDGHKMNNIFIEGADRLRVSMTIRGEKFSKVYDAGEIDNAVKYRDSLDKLRNSNKGRVESKMEDEKFNSLKAKYLSMPW